MSPNVISVGQDDGHKKLNMKCECIHLVVYPYSKKYSGCEIEYCYSFYCLPNICVPFFQESKVWATVSEYVEVEAWGWVAKMFLLG